MKKEKVKATVEELRRSLLGTIGERHSKTTRLVLEVQRRVEALEAKAEKIEPLDLSGARLDDLTAKTRDLYAKLNEMHAMLVRAFKAAQTEIDTLHARLADEEGITEELARRLDKLEPPPKASSPAVPIVEPALAQVPGP
jgi:predicted RNase H-like nuclease (RuvC/YqgF family)